MSRPHLLYVYPWMPYPRRVTLYLRERDIAPALVTVVPVSDPQKGDKIIPPGLPARPRGSLPILAIPSPNPTHPTCYTYLSQSVAIMNYLEDLCDAQVAGFPQRGWPMRGGLDPLRRAKELGYMQLADQALACWNPVRLFGTGAGPISIPRAAKEALVWEKRELGAIEAFLKQQQEEEGDADLVVRSSRDSDTNGSVSVGYGPSIGDIMLFSFLELANDMYGRDMTVSTSAKVKDAYGRDVVESSPMLHKFYRLFKSRTSAQRRSEDGEVVPLDVRTAGTTWADEVFGLGYESNGLISSRP